MEWFRSYLNGRKQYVFLNSASSSYSEVNCGVPQGSILGPLLFIIYINDIVNSSKLLNFILFADDTNIIYSHNDLAQLQKVVNHELSKLSNWFKSNMLSLNAIKTNFMLFGFKPIPSTSTQFELRLDGNVLERVKVTKFLGVYVDEKLKWNDHINHVVSKVSRGLGMLGRVRNVLSNDVMKT